MIRRILMNLTIFRLIFGLILLSIIGCPAAAEDMSAPITDPSAIGVGARPLGMGKAGVAFSDDANTIFLNPAGLGSINKLLMTSMFTNLMGDVDYIIAGGTLPIAEGSTIGLGVISSNVSGIPLYDEFEAPQGEGTFGSHMGLLSFGLDLGKAEFSDTLKDVSVGITGKYFMQTGSGCPDAKLADGSGMSLDLGILYSPGDRLSVGVSAQNLLGSKMAYKAGPEIDIPTLIKVGGKMNVFGKDRPQRLILAADMDIYDSYSLLHAGIEYSPLKALAIRAGIDQDSYNDETISNMTLGVGLKYGDFQFDYAYHPFGDIEENTTHFFSISFAGKEELIFAEKPKDSSRAVTEREELITFTDVPETHWARESIENLGTAGIVTGFPDGTFRPEKTLTRGELATVLVRIKDIPFTVNSKDSFTDVSKEHWVAKYVEAAKNAGLVIGYPDGSFRPYAKISREEGVTVMARLEELEEMAEELKEDADESQFIDIGNSWAAGYIMAANEVGLLEYLGDAAKFMPKSVFTRAEAAEILSKTTLGIEKIKSMLASLEDKKIANSIR